MMDETDEKFFDSVFDLKDANLSKRKLREMINQQMTEFKKLLRTEKLKNMGKSPAKLKDTKIKISAFLRIFWLSPAKEKA